MPNIVLILPMRNGNRYLQPLLWLATHVLILPMRNGNLYSNLIVITQFLVLILPMRNGNIWGVYYEKGLYAIVLILPMRNGNHLYQIYFWRRNFVLILPMRNGNIGKQWLYFRDSIVLILPMRNGNHIFANYYLHTIWFLSYLWGMETIYCQYHYIILFSSYPTYEEWKPSNIDFLVASYSRSYPTYEEWKPESERISLYSSVFVLILPMRNGNNANINLSTPTKNSSYPTYEEWKHVSSFLRKYNNSGSFLSYLWGMETSHMVVYVDTPLQVLILPMRNGNLL